VAYTGIAQIVHIAGPVVARVHVRIGDLCTHTVSLCMQNDALCSRFVSFVYYCHLRFSSIGIHNTVDITKTDNFELAMRFDTDIESGNTFHTDLNAIQVSRLP
jgi:hypothetical protein